MNEVRFTLTENARLAPNVYRLRLAGDASAITAPGQFLEITIPGFFLRRPLSVCDWEDGSVTILYRAVGDGTRALAKMKPGKTIDALCGLGNGFDVTACGEKTLVIGGGIGVPPMYSFVTDELPEAFDTFCACGTMPMLRALCARTEKPGFLSLEARMGCGFGACMGCTIETAHGPKRICKEGPVFRKEELIW